MVVLLFLFYLLTPLFILFLCHKFTFLDKLGSVLIAYILGMVVGNIGILEGYGKVQEYVTTITIPLAISLLLFSSNMKEWIGLTSKTLTSMLVAIIALILAIGIGYFLFKTDEIKDFWKIPGMLVGVYTGGTPNLASLKIMLDVDPNLYILTHTYDMIISSLFIFFLMTIGKKVFLLILPDYKMQSQNGTEASNIRGANPFTGIFSKKRIVEISKALGVSLLIFGIAASASLLVPKNGVMAVVILVITTLGIIASFVPAVNKIEKSFELGMYLILIFSLDVASMSDIRNFSGIAPNLLYYITFAIFGSLLLHVLFAWFFKIDTDTVVITSTALTCSPPFVPLIAASLKNKQIIIPGITVGVIGYAIGNYLGFILAGIFRHL